MCADFTSPSSSLKLVDLGKTAKATYWKNARS
jgi:hypothetical protein